MAAPGIGPLPLTVATAVLLELHLTGCPVSTVPPASLSVALSCCVAPTSWLTELGLTVTAATDAVDAAAVVPLAMFDNAPNTAFTVSVPRYATLSTSYRVAAATPLNKHVRVAPMAL